MSKGKNGEIIKDPKMGRKDKFAWLENNDLIDRDTNQPTENHAWKSSKKHVHRMRPQQVVPPIVVRMAPPLLHCGNSA